MPKEVVECCVKSVDRVFVLRCSPLISTEKILGTILQRYGVVTHRWFSLVKIIGQKKEVLIKKDKKITVKDLEKFPNAQYHLKMVVTVFPTLSGVELKQDCEKVLLWKYELMKSITDPKYTILLESRVLLAVCLAKLISHEKNIKISKELVEPFFDTLMQKDILKSYGLYRAEVFQMVMDLLLKVKFMHFMELIEKCLELLEKSPLYGLSYFQITNKKLTKLFLGVDSSGLLIFDASSLMQPRISFSWGEMQQATFKGSKIIIYLVEKGIPPFEFEILNTESTESIIHTILENHDYFKIRTSLIDNKKSSEYKEKEALCQQDKQSRKIENEILFYEERIEDAFRIITTSWCSESKITELEKCYEKLKEAIKKKISHLENLNEQREKLSKISKDSDCVFLHTVRLTEEEIKVFAQDNNAVENHFIDLELEKLTQQMPALETEAEEKREKIKEIKAKHPKGPTMGAECQDSKELSVADSEQLQKERSDKMNQELRKINECLPSNNKVDPELKELNEWSKEGNNKSKTMAKAIKANNTRSRIDLYESL